MEVVEVTKPYKGDSDKIQFFYDLVNNDKSLRQQTQDKLKTYLSTHTDIKLKELIDINNYLYDAMWNADGYDIQKEFADYYGKLLFIMPKSNIIMFIRSMLISTMNKWTIMDKHRINKYYAMIRQIIHHLFSYLSLNEYESPLYEDILEHLQKIVFLKEPLGVAYHIYDILLHELHLASPNITTDQYLKLLFCVMESCAFQDKVYIRKCKDQIFHPLIFEYLPQSDLKRPLTLKIIQTDSSTNIRDNIENKNSGDNNNEDIVGDNDKTPSDTVSSNTGTNGIDENKTSNFKIMKVRTKKNNKNKKVKKIEPRKIKSFPHIDVRQLIQPIFNFASQKDCSSIFRKMLYFLTNTYKKYCQQNFDAKDVPSIVIEKPPLIEDNDENKTENNINLEEERGEDDNSAPDLSPGEDNRQTGSIKKKKTKKVLRFNNKVTVRHIPSQKRKKSISSIPEVAKRKPKMVRH